MDSFTPPKSVREAAQRALDVRDDKPPSQRGMTDVGLARARDLSNGRPVSLETVRRMVAYFDRHQSDKEGETWGDRGKGWQAWNGWGGDPGRTWAEGILREHDSEKSVRVLKVDDERRLVTIVGYVSRDPAGRILAPEHRDDDGTAVDHSGETISAEDLEDAISAYMATDRDVDVMHEQGTGEESKLAAECVQAFVFTDNDVEALEGLGMDADFPRMALLKIKVHSDELWADVKAGKLPMASLAGFFEREELEDAEA